MSRREDERQMQNVLGSQMARERTKALWTDEFSTGIEIMEENIGLLYTVQSVRRSDNEASSVPIL